MFLYFIFVFGNSFCFCYYFCLLIFFFFVLFLVLPLVNPSCEYVTAPNHSTSPNEICQGFLDNEENKADQNSNLPLEDIYPGGYESKPVNTLSSTTSTGVTLDGI